MKSIRESHVGGRLRWAAAVLALALVAAPVASQTANGMGRGSGIASHGLLRGIVFDDSTQAALVAVSMTLVDEAGEMASKISQSDSAGYFEVMVPAAGRYRLVARREGYQSVMSSDLEMGLGESMEMEIPLAVTGVPRTRAMILNREALALLNWTPEPYERRRARGSGRFIGPELLRRTRAQPVADLLGALGWRGAPAARLAEHAPPARARECWPLFLINGAPTNAAEADVLRLSTAELRAVELYRGDQVPRELAGGRGCGVAVLWTR